MPWKNWFGADKQLVPASTEAPQEKPLVYYAGIDNLTLYDAPGGKAPSAIFLSTPRCCVTVRKKAMPT